MPLSIEFLKKINWDLDIEEVKCLFNGLNSMAHPTENAIGFCDLFYEINSLIICYFRKNIINNDKLIRVNINSRFEKPEDDIIEKIYTQIKNDVIIHYGNPTHKVQNPQMAPIEVRRSEMLVWRVDRNSILNLSMGLKRNNVCHDLLGVSIMYGDIQNDPISQQWNWLK